jgi:hypothetical protein
VEELVEYRSFYALANVIFDDLCYGEAERIKKKGCLNTDIPAVKNTLASAANLCSLNLAFQ